MLVRRFTCRVSGAASVSCSAFAFIRGSIVVFRITPASHHCRILLPHPEKIFKKQPTLFYAKCSLEIGKVFKPW